MMWHIPPTPVQKLESLLLTNKNINVYIKRDDLTHLEVMGNKWRKLKYNLLDAKSKGIRTIVTFGGAFSNHIAATAAACALEGFKSVGIIRGEELTENSNLTLQDAARNGMELQFVNRSDFRQMKESLTLRNPPPDPYTILPEGGTNNLAIKGCNEILPEVEVDYDICCTAIGTGGTFTGLLKSLPPQKELWGFCALKGDWIDNHIADLRSTHNVSNTHYRLFQEDRFGGYARFEPTLIQFILDFRQEYGILLDPIYTGKMFFRVWDMIKNDQIAKETTLLLIHSGGLQGNNGFNVRFDLNLPLP